MHAFIAYDIVKNRLTGMSVWNDIVILFIVAKLKLISAFKYTLSRVLPEISNLAADRRIMNRRVTRGLRVGDP